MQPDLEEGAELLRVVVLPAGDGDQGAQPVQHPGRFAIARHRQAGAEPFENLGQRLRSAFEHAQQVDEGEVLAQTPRKRDPPSAELMSASTDSPKKTSCCART